ncbi:MAG: dockerin type I repeat-containing protein [Clostridia bacterium]|nr:dockerin type I repeat-containing protein [Clostridia bacterium]
MKRSKFFCRIISAAISLSLALTTIFSASAFDTDYISKEGMELAYSIINGYSKLAAEKGKTSFKTSAIYSGLDVTNPYVITLVGCFYFTNGVDIDKASSDNEYTMTTIAKLDGFLKAMGVKNERSQATKKVLEDSDVKMIMSFETAGLYIVSADEDFNKSMLNDDNVDFVLSGGMMPTSMKDLNLDGKSDVEDGALIQLYLAGKLEYDDDDINEYVKFACDINGDKEINILDVTELQTRE